jgi:RpiR family transcriptional regulator, carbohydrate utilization regulator
MIIATIQQKLPDLRKSERKVAEFVIGHPTAVSTSLSELARLVGVSEPTVIRFSRAVGCAGFQDLKLKLAADLARRMPLVNRDVTRGDSASTFAGRMTERLVSALLSARNRADARLLESAISLLHAADHIHIYGFGASGYVAQDARHKFARLGLACSATSDPHEQSTAAAMMSGGDVILAISHTGASRHLIETVTRGRQNAARVIAMTATGSPLAALADVLIAADVNEDSSTLIPMISRIVHLHLIDTLQVGVALKRGPEIEPRLADAKTALTPHRLASDTDPNS